jgi:large conductance mechanosensitive channel
MLGEFKKFAMRGNVVDMAVGIVIGGAFGKIVSSFVGDVLMPPIGVVLGGVDLSRFFISLNGQHYDTLAAAEAAGAPALRYGNFLNTTIDFLIVAFAMFLLVKGINRLRELEERALAPAPAAPPAPTTKTCPECMSEISIQAKRCPYCTSKVG